MGIIKAGISSCAMDEPAQTATCDSNPDPDNFGVECQDGDDLGYKNNSFDDNDNSFHDNDNSFDDNDNSFDDNDNDNSFDDNDNSFDDYDNSFEDNDNNFEDNNDSFESHETRFEVDGQPRERSKSKYCITYVSVFVVMMTTLSFINGAGTLFPYILEEFNETRASTAAVQSVFKGFGLCSGLVVGVMVQHFGPRNCGVLGAVLFSMSLVLSAFVTSIGYLIVSFGIISGLGGVAILYLSANQAVSHCFSHKTRLLAISAATSSIGIGGIIYPYLLQYLVYTYGLRGALLLTGGTTMNAIPLTLLWRSPKNRNLKTISEELSSYAVTKASSDDDMSITVTPSMCSPDAIDEQCDFLSLSGSRDSLQNEDTGEYQSSRNPFLTIRNNILAIMANNAFLFLLLGFCFALPSQNMFEILLLDILESCKLQRSQSIVLLMILNAMCVPGRLIPGLIVKLPSCSSGMAPIVGSVISGVGVILLSLCRGYNESVVACVFLGLAKGTILGCLSVVPLEMLGPKRFSTGLGIICFVAGLCTSILGPMNGYIRDSSGSYRISLYLAGGSLFVANVFCLVSLFVQRRKRVELVRTIQDSSPRIYVT